MQTIPNLWKIKDVFHLCFYPRFVQFKLTVRKEKASKGKMEVPGLPTFQQVAHVVIVCREREYNSVVYNRIQENALKGLYT